MLNVNELKVKQLLEEAIDKYGPEYLCVDAYHDEDENETLSIYYFNAKDDLGIGIADLSLEGINLNHIKDMAKALNVSFENLLPKGVTLSKEELLNLLDDTFKDCQKKANNGWDHCEQAYYEGASEGLSFAMEQIKQLLTE